MENPLEMFKFSGFLNILFDLIFAPIPWNKTDLDANRLKIRIIQSWKHCL